MTRDPSAPVRYLSTAEAARSIGVSTWWVRERIEAGLLPALAIRGSRRMLYRIREDDWARFRARYTGAAGDPRLE